MKQELEVSIVLPIFNEEENITPALNEIKCVMDATPFSYEIIAVNDGSTDGSSFVLDDEAKKSSVVKVIHFRKNVGQSAAFDAGFQHAQGKFIASLDADLQNDPMHLPEMLKMLQAENIDVVTGWRKKRKDGFILRLLPSRIANFTVRKITKTKIHDLGCSLRVYRAELIKEVRLYGEMHRFICPILENNGANIKEVVVNHRPRVAGKSKYGLSRTMKVILDLVHIWYVRNFQTKPFHVFGGIGLATILLGALFAGITLYQKFSLGIYVHNNPLFIVVVLLCVVGFQFFCTGLIAETVTKTYFESQGLTHYKIKKLVNFELKAPTESAS